MYDAPVPEVSGACFAGDRLVVVGDSDPVVAWTTWDDGPGSWTTLDVSALPGAPADTGQFEAVEHLHDDVVVILCEEPALLVAVDLGDREVVGSWHLQVELKGLAKPWRKDPNSHGEGFFFGPDRLFIVKEKKPAAVIEFGLPGQESIGAPRVGGWAPPREDVVTALAWIELDLDDVSDVCVVGDDIWLLSDQARSMQMVGGPAVALPKRITKPEGLARTPDGRWLVAVDSRDGAGSLHVLDPA